MIEKIFAEIKPEQITDNTFKLIGKDWMLITAGSPESYNTMTASWGGLGVLWNKDVCFCFVRPSRYTYDFMEKADSFTLSFFDEQYREALKLCGTKSGRDIDKAAATGLTPISGITAGTTCFSEASIVVECRKIYFQDLIPENFLDPSIEDSYNGSDYHRMYIGEIAKIRIKK